MRKMRLSSTTMVVESARPETQMGRISVPVRNPRHARGSAGRAVNSVRDVDFGRIDVVAVGLGGFPGGAAQGILRGVMRELGMGWRMTSSPILTRTFQRFLSVSQLTCALSAVSMGTPFEQNDTTARRRVEYGRSPAGAPGRRFDGPMAGSRMSAFRRAVRGQSTTGQRPKWIVSGRAVIEDLPSPGTTSRCSAEKPAAFVM